MEPLLKGSRKKKEVCSRVYGVWCVNETLFKKKKKKKKGNQFSRCRITIESHISRPFEGAYENKKKKCSALKDDQPSTEK